MPFVSETALAKIKTEAQNAKNRAAAASKKLSDTDASKTVMMVIEGVGGAMGAGWARGKWGDPATGQWLIPGTEIDVELFAFVGLVGVSLVGDQVGLKAFQPHARNLALGVGAHYFGQVARLAGKTGDWNLIAGGTGRPAIGHGLPQYDPTSYDPTQFAAPYDDPVASALSASGV